MGEKEKKLIITPLHRSKEVSQVLANDTCRSILDIVSDNALSASQISKKLGLPLTTVDYNLKKLLEVDLIDVDHKRWSPKGKKVNYYAPKKKFILLAPGFSGSEAMQALKGLLPILALVVVALVLFGFISIPQHLGESSAEFTITQTQLATTNETGEITTPLTPSSSFERIYGKVAPPTEDETATGAPAMNLLSQETIDQGANSGIDQKNYLVIQKQSLWDEIWIQTQTVIPMSIIPEVDFDTNTILAVFMDEQSTGGYSIEILGVEELSDRVVVYVQETSPGPEDIVTEALSQPYHMVKTDKITKPVEFQTV